MSEKISKKKQLEKTFIKIYGQPIFYEKHKYGMSGVGFCLQKMVIKKRFKVETKVNGNMVMGKIGHNDLKKLVKNHPYGKAHLPKTIWGWFNPYNWYRIIFLRPRYEKIVKHDFEGGFGTNGHCDIDFPALDLIVEYKTTGSNREWLVGTGLTDAYILQANGYACALKRKKWELWILYKMFDDILEDSFISIIEGDADMEIFEEFEERLSIVEQCVKDGTDLDGIPEMSWECRNCSMIVLCHKWNTQLETFLNMLPSIKKDLVAATSDKMFELMSKSKKIRYNREQKVYKLVKKDEEYGSS